MDINRNLLSNKILTPFLLVAILLSCATTFARKPTDPCISTIADFYTTNSGSFQTAKCLNQYGLNTDKLNLLRQLTKHAKNKEALLKIISQTPVGYEEKVNSIVKEMSLKSLSGEAYNLLINEKIKIYNLQGKYNSVLSLTNKLKYQSAVDDSIYYMRAVALLNKNKLNSALKAMGKAVDIYEAKDKKALTEFDLKFGDILFSSYGKILNAKKLYTESEEAYKKVRTSSPIWPEGLTEVSWTYLALKKEPKALGNAFFVQKSTSELSWKPSLLLAQSIGFLKLCHYPEAKKSIDIINNHYKTIYNKIRRKSGNNLYDYFVASINRPANKSYKSYPIEVLRYLGVQPDILRLQTAINNYLTEVENIEAMRKRFKFIKTPATNAAYKNFKSLTKSKISTLSSKANYIQKIANTYMKQNLKSLTIELKNILTQADLVEFEILSRSGDEIRGRSLGKEVKAKVTSPFKLYGKSELKWGYLGENWKDEKGGVESVIKSRCELKTKP